MTNSNSGLYSMEEREIHLIMKTFLGLFISLITFYSIQLSATDSIASAKGGIPTVCQWLSREGRKLYLCGAQTDVAAMTKEARIYQKTTVHKEIKTSALKIEITNDNQASSSLESVTSHPKRTGYLVQAIGKTENIVKELVAIADKDYQVLKTIKKVSLGVFSKYENAQGRQTSLAALGIASERIDRSSSSIVQLPERQPQQVKPMQTPIKPIEAIPKLEKKKNIMFNLTKEDFLSRRLIMRPKPYPCLP
jgi:hypothetical protein